MLIASAISSTLHTVVRVSAGNDRWPMHFRTPFYLADSQLVLYVLCLGNYSWSTLLSQCDLYLSFAIAFFEWGPSLNSASVYNRLLEVVLDKSMVNLLAHRWLPVPADGSSSSSTANCVTAHTALQSANRFSLSSPNCANATHGTVNGLCRRQRHHSRRPQFSSARPLCPYLWKYVIDVSVW